MESGYILTIDSAMSGCSAGVYDISAGEILAQKSLEMTRGQAEHLMPMIVNVLSEAKLTFSDLTKVAVTRGPGAFTGMRIAIATAKTLGISLDIPVIGVSTLDVIMHDYISSEGAYAEDYDMYVVLLETKRQDFYTRFYDSGFNAIDQAQASEAQDIMQRIERKNCLIIGDAYARFKSCAQCDFNHVDYMMPTNLSLAILALNTDDVSCAPLYLRPPDVSLPKVPPRKISK